MTDEFDFAAEDKVETRAEDVGYRILLDVQGEDVALLDELARSENLEPTQLFLHALRVYSQRASSREANVRAISRLSIDLRRVLTVG